MIKYIGKDPAHGIHMARVMLAYSNVVITSDSKEQVMADARLIHSTKQSSDSCPRCNPPKEDEKVCFICKRNLPLEAFDRTENKHLLKQPAQKGRCYSCNKCAKKKSKKPRKRKAIRSTATSKASGRKCDGIKCVQRRGSCKLRSTTLNSSNTTY